MPAPGRTAPAAPGIAASIGQARLDPGWFSRLALLLFMLVAVLGATACTQKFVRNGLPVAMLDEARSWGGTVCGCGATSTHPRRSSG
jgi:hypothetical protein